MEGNDFQRFIESHYLCEQLSVLKIGTFSELQNYSFDEEFSIRPDSVNCNAFRDADIFLLVTFTLILDVVLNVLYTNMYYERCMA